MLFDSGVGGLTVLAEGVERESQAALLRDKLAALEKSLEKQRAVAADRGDRDILSVVMENGLVIVTVLWGADLLAKIGERDQAGFGKDDFRLISEQVTSDGVNAEIFVLHPVSYVEFIANHINFNGEIGRASCRERV